MKEFRPLDNTIKINMGTAVFEGDPSKVEVAHGKAFKLISDLNDKVNSGLADDDKVAETMQTLVDVCDSIFGKKSVSKILGKDTVCFHDLCDIFVYIRKCCFEFEQSKTKQYDKYYNQNREQRRAK